MSLRNNINIQWKYNLNPNLSQQDIYQKELIYISQTRKQWMKIYLKFMDRIVRLWQQKKYSLSVVFIDEEWMTQLNDTYRHRSESTDILSFAYHEAEDFIPYSDKLTNPYASQLIRGDLIISLNNLQKNVYLYHVSYNEELKRLSLHGFLHLLSYDHLSTTASEPMLVWQERILEKFKDVKIWEI